MIKKNGTLPAYSRGIDQVQAARQEAIARGWIHVPKALTLVHGECDVQAGNSLLYPGYMNELRNDYQQDLRQLTGDPNLFLPMFFSQTCSRGPAFMAPQQLNAHRMYDNEMFMVGPTYQFFSPDYVHLSNEGYKGLGELFGKVMHKVLVLGEDWSPLMPISVVRQSRDIYVRYHVPVPPIAMDVTIVAERANGSDRINKGFQFFQTGGNGNSVWVQDVTIVGPDLIKLTLNALPTGTDQVVHYSARPVYGLVGGMSNAQPALQGGNIRDSDTTTSWSSISTGQPIYNWGVAFVESIYENQPPQMDTIALVVNGGTPFLASPFQPFFTDDQPFDPAGITLNYAPNTLLDLVWQNDTLGLNYLSALWPSTLAGTLVYTDQYGAKDTVVFTITVLCPQPFQAPTVTAPTWICAGATAVLTAQGGTDYLWSTGGTQSTVSVSPTAPAVYTVTASQNNCSASASYLLHVEPTPPVAASLLGAACLNGILSLGATGGISYEWSGPGGFASQLQQPFRSPLTPGTAGAYTVTATDALGCTASAQTVVSPLPAFSVQAVNNGPVCLDASLQLSVSGGVAYQWSGPDGFSSTQQTATIAPAGPANAGLYAVTATNAIGCSIEASTAVLVVAPPSVSASIGSTICSGENFTISVSNTGLSAYSWSGPDNFTSAQSQPILANATAAMAGTYTVTATDQYGCTATASALADVHPLPTAQAVNSGPFCLDDSFSLSGSGGVAYQWTGPNGFTAAGQNQQLGPADPTMAGPYVLTVADPLGCTASAATVVQFIPPPAVQIVQSPAVCYGGTLQLGTTPANFSLFSWSGPMGFASGLSGPTVQNVQFNNNGTYEVTVTDAFGCTNSSSAQVTLLPLPSMVARDTSVCGFYNGGVALQSLVSPPGGQLVWSGTATSPNGLFSVPAAGIGTYTVTALYALTGSGCSVSDQAVVTVTADQPAEAGTGFAICGQSPATVLVPGNPSGGVWSGPGVTGIALFDPTLNMANQSPVTLTYTVGTGTCQSSDTVWITVWPDPIVQLTTPAPVCLGRSVGLQAAGGVQYAWSGPNGFAATGPQISIASVSPAQAGTYSVTVTDARTCTASASAAVAVMLPPVLRGFDGDTAFCLSANTVNLPQILPAGGVWLPATGVTGNQFSLPTAGVGTHVVRYAATGANGCSDTAAFQIQIVDEDSVFAGPDVTVCINNGPLALNGFYPATGGFWTGTGINNPWQAVFYPSFAGVGTHLVQYINLGGLCQSRDTVLLHVINAQPQVEAGPDLLFCEGAQAFLLDGAFPPGGTWSGPGVADPITGLFDPAQSGIGWHIVTYSIQNCNAYDIREVEITAPPQPGFNIQGTIQYNYPIYFVNTSSPNNLTYLWDFGDGNTSQLQDPIHFYLQTGVFTVTLYATDANGCPDSVSRTISIVMAGLDQPASAWDAAVFPNPSDRSAVVGLAGPWSGKVEASVVGMDGRVLLAREFPDAADGGRLELSTGELPSGSYFVRISGRSATVVKRLVVQH